jgi:hypothetical protein
MLINLSNHPYNQWSEKQKETAQKQYGMVQDMTFPMVDPSATTKEIKELALTFYKKITTIIDQCANEPYPNAVHIQGEFTFVFNLVTLLKKSEISCVASTSTRNVKQIGEKKIINFKFVQFREY